MGRWSNLEENLLIQMKEKMRDILICRPQYPEVVGDRRIMRFIRGNGHNLTKAVESMTSFLLWRTANGVDKIREDIVFGGKNKASLFPKGKIILSLVPQHCLITSARDRQGNPISIEFFNFDPSLILREISLDEYLLFLTYTLEFKMIILEQLSQEEEERILATGYDKNDPSGYGVILKHFVIRDLKGIGMAHVGQDGQRIVKAALALSERNYSELLSKLYIINAPWMFTVIWYFAKSIIDPSTAAKISIHGADYSTAMLEDIEANFIPVQFGGTFEPIEEEFHFDTSPEGPLACLVSEQLVVDQTTALDPPAL